MTTLPATSQAQFGRVSLVRMVPKTRNIQAVTSAVDQPMPTQSLHPRDETCGSLNGYPNAEPPICTGAKQYCTFSQGYQGCCDSHDDCTFYTTCNGGLAATTCAGASCLQCPRATPYCSRFQLVDVNSVSFQGFACGPYDVTDSLIYGYASTSTTTFIGASSASSAISSSSSDKSSTDSNGHSSLSMSTTSSLPASATTSDPSQATFRSSSHTNKGAIIGGVVGGVAGFALLVVLGCFFFRKRLFGTKKRRLPELQQGSAAMRQTYHRG